MHKTVWSEKLVNLLWVSGSLPGSVHDMKAAWTWGIEDELAAADLPALADKGYQGAVHAKTPCRGKGKPESQKEANRAHAKLRAPGERANAQLKAWKILTRLRRCPAAQARSPKPSSFCKLTRSKPDEKGS